MEITSSVKLLLVGAGVLLAAGACRRAEPVVAADLLLVNAHVYTLTWPDPDGDGRPAASAPHGPQGWTPNAEAVAIRQGRIVFAGDRTGADAYRGPSTIVRDLAGATVLPGLADAHVHLPELGASLERVNLVGVKTEAEAVERVAARAATVPAGEWIVGWGWDEGAWANHYPDMRLLSQRVPNHPVMLRGLHSFASWGNAVALARAGITAATKPPAGGEILRDAAGVPTGILTNNASQLLERAVPAPTPAQLDARVIAALESLAAAGYSSVHEAGGDTALMAALERIAAAGRLPIRVYAMLAARDPAVVDARTTRGPDRDNEPMLVTRSVKAFYDGAMGSRGAFFLEPYDDQPGHRGKGGAEYGFDGTRMTALMRAGFQIVVHAIGDRANRETLDLIEAVERESPASRLTRPRIEHAQVVAPGDIPRFASLNVIASMQPSHAVEDMAWAAARIGADRLKGAYAWRTLRRAGARLVFSSDLPATDYSVFYGWHSAVTRQDRSGQPAAGWRPEERMTIEEAVRGWTTWAAYASFREDSSGVLAPGRWADVTVMNLDPFQIGERDPTRLLDGRILLTIVGGKIVHDSHPKQLP